MSTKSNKNANKNNKNNENAKQQNATKDAKNAQQNATKKSAIATRTDALKKQIKTKSNIVIETSETARNKANSASVLYENFIALTVVSDEQKSAHRVIEIWVHKNRNDIVVERALLQNEKLKKYAKSADDKKTKRALVKLDNDKITIEFVNAVITIL